MIFGILLLARFASDIMEYLLAKRHEAMISKIMNNTLITQEQIDEFDVDKSGNIDRFEYLSKMLILTNEVQPDVIYKIMQKFNEIDKDNNGNISLGDFEIFQHEDDESKRNSKSSSKKSSNTDVVDVM